jgi:hypothetical protein
VAGRTVLLLGDFRGMPRAKPPVTRILSLLFKFFYFFRQTLHFY